MEGDEIPSLSLWERVGVRASHLAPVLVLLLSACPPPPGTCAEREFVGVGGDIPSRGPIFTPDAGDPPLGVQGQPLTVKVFAPRTGCQRDRLSARAELLGPDNFPVTDVTIAEPRLSGDVVSVEVSFTPDQAGQYLLQLTFEPALGVRSLLLDVGELRTSPPSIRVDVPMLSSCVDSVWPLTVDTVACERVSDTIELYSSDGGSTSFQGKQLVVAGTVLWSVAATSELERREFVDGGLLVTHRFPDFSSDRTVRGLHDESTALRALSSGALVLASIDGGVPVLDLDRMSNEVGEQLLFADQGVLFTEMACTFDPCFGLRGLEPGMWWKNSFSGQFIEGVERPVNQDRMGPDVTITRAAEFVQPPQRGFERIPLWLAMPGGRLSALVNADRPSLGLTMWNRADVIRVGKQFVLLRDPSQSNVVLVTPR